MTNSECILSAKSHDCLITWSREVTWGGVTYYRRYIYCLSTVDITSIDSTWPPYMEERLYCWGSLKDNKVKSSRTVRMRL